MSGTNLPVSDLSLVFPGKPIVFLGKPIEIRYERGLRDTRGNEAHAATYIRQRLIVLDGELERCAGEHRRILTHELFHFVWVRLGNSRRHSWEQLLRTEWRAEARGEAGWSAEWRKRELSDYAVDARTIRWREYCCESFCDTAAWMISGVDAELTLPRRYRSGRRKWFRALSARALPI